LGPGKAHNGGTVAPIRKILGGGKALSEKGGLVWERLKKRKDNPRPRRKKKGPLEIARPLPGTERGNCRERRKSLLGGIRDHQILVITKAVSWRGPVRRREEAKTPQTPPKRRAGGSKRK